MKVFISVIVILSLLICGFIGNYFFLKAHSDAIIKNLNKLEKYAFKNDDNGLDSAYLNLEKSWEESKNVLFVFSNHKDLDDIYKSFLKIKVRISQKDYYGIIEEIEIAKHLAKEAPNKELPFLSNIF